MARILLIDPNETARRALSGILARGGHRLVAVDSPEQAWSFIRRNPCTDLVFMELRLGPADALGFVQRLKADCTLRLLPVVVYTAEADRSAVKRAIELRVQNFLMKPYHDDEVFAEIDKADANPWRDRLFEEEKSFCQLMGLTPGELHRSLGLLRDSLRLLREPLQAAATLEDATRVSALIQPLHDEAETVGAWGVVESLDQLTGHVADGRWRLFPADLESLDFAAQLIPLRLHPDQFGTEFLAQEERDAETRRLERQSWLSAPALGHCPVVPWDQLRSQIDGLRGCPVTDTSAAAFQMAANGHPSSINPIMDLVARDPGLSAQMLIAANRAHPVDEDFNRIEDARLAIGQLGELALEAEARNLLVTPEPVFNLAPAFNWTRFWTFQRGVARVAQLICRDLDFSSLEPIARTAGQLHDIGKLVLAHLQPAGFQAILEYSRQYRLPLREAEMLFLGATSAQIAGHFATGHGLSRRLGHVMRWVGDPAGAPEDRILVAIVSLARSLCHFNEVGTCGEPRLGPPSPLETTPEWAILREGLYPSFNSRKFELQIHACCGRLRTELSGHQAGTIADIVSTADRARA